jgi:hypothetical protein
VTTRQALHDLVDRLPEEQLDAAEERLSELTPVSREEFWKRLDEAPYDDEPLSERESRALGKWDRGESRSVAYTEAEIQQLIDDAARLGRG